MRRSAPLLILCAACASQPATGTSTAPTRATAESDAGCTPHLTAWLPSGESQSYFALDAMRDSPWQAHYVRFTNETLGPRWLRTTPAKRLAVGANTGGSVVIVDPADDAAEPPGPQVAPGVWAVAGEPKATPAEDRCLEDFEGVTIWVRLGGAAMARLMPEPHPDMEGFEPVELVFRVSEDRSGAVTLRVTLDTRPPAESDASIRERLEGIEGGLRELFEETFGEGAETTIELKPTRWTVTLTTDAETEIRQLVDGVLSFGAEPSARTPEQSARLICEDPVPAFRERGVDAVWPFWLEQGADQHTRGLMCALLAADTATQLLFMRRHASNGGLDECPLAELLEGTDKRIDPPDELRALCR